MKLKKTEVVDTTEIKTRRRNKEIKQKVIVCLWLEKSLIVQQRDQLNHADNHAVILSV